MCKSRCAVVLLTGLALLAGSSALLADPGQGKGKGKGENPAWSTEPLDHGGHGWPDGASQGQRPHNGKGRPAQLGGQTGRDGHGQAPQWGGAERDRDDRRDGYPRQWPDGRDARGGRDDWAERGDYGGLDRERIRRVIGDNRGYWGSGQSLPPGIRKNLQRGKPLPPGIARQRLDSRLESRLPRFPGYEWTRVGPDLVQLSTSTGVVNQVLSGMFQ